MTSTLATQPPSTHLTQPDRFAQRLADPFIYKSVSEETRRAYTRIIREFFGFVRNIHPVAVTPQDVIRFRDQLAVRRQRPATVCMKLAVVRSFFEYLRAGGALHLNPASSRLVTPPEVSSEPSGRALTVKEVRYILAGPNRETATGARDYAILKTMLRLSLRVSEVGALRASSIKWSHGRWTLRCKIKGGKEEVWPLPKDVKEAIDAYLKLDARRRALLHSDGPEAFLFQPHTNYRTLQFDKALTTRSIGNIVARWGVFTGVGKVSPHDLRRTAITRALEQGQTYRQVQMMSKHRDPKTVMRYDHGRQNLEQSSVNFLDYGEQSE